MSVQRTDTPEGLYWTLLCCNFSSAFGDSLAKNALHRKKYRRKSWLKLNFTYNTMSAQHVDPLKREI